MYKLGYTHTHLASLLNLNLRASCPTAPVWPQEKEGNKAEDAHQGQGCKYDCISIVCCSKRG